MFIETMLINPKMPKDKPSPVILNMAHFQSAVLASDPNMGKFCQAIMRDGLIYTLVEPAYDIIKEAISKEATFKTCIKVPVEVPAPASAR